MIEETDIVAVMDIVEDFFRIFKDQCNKPEGRSTDFVGLFIEAIEAGIEEKTGVNPTDKDTEDLDYTEMAMMVAQAYADLPTAEDRDLCEREYCATLQNIYMHHNHRIIGPLLYYLTKKCKGEIE